MKIKNYFNLLWFGLWLALNPLYAQQPARSQGQIRGLVVDSNNEAVPGATVTLYKSGTRNNPVSAVFTNETGSFNLVNIPANEKYDLVVTAVSFTDYEENGFTVRPNDNNSMSITLKTDTKLLNEVVVVGFGTQKKANLTGAVQSIRADEFENRPVTNVSSAIQGRLAGVTVIQNSGQPGKDQGSIRIRGIGTINGSDPLVLVDGIESSMNNVNPLDIESVTVLKDAASAAIYGSKAANGVILITTKLGKPGKPQLSYSGYIGSQKPTAVPNYLRSFDHATLLNEALQNEKKPLRFTDADLAEYKKGLDTDTHPDTDWLGGFYTGSGLQQSHNVQLSGGSANTSYFVSLGYLNQLGVIEVAKSDRYNIRANVNTSVTDKLDFGIGLGYVVTNTVEPTNPYTGDMAQIFRQINRIPSFIKHKYSNGMYGFYGDGNPLAWMDLKAKDLQDNNQLYLTLTGSYQITKGLKFKQIFGYQPRNYSSNKFVKNIQFVNFPSGTNALLQGANSNLTDYRYNENRVTHQSLLTYEKELGKNNLSVLLGYMQEAYNFNNVQGYRTGFLNNNLYVLNAGAPDGQAATGGASALNLRSYFGRVNYVFDSKYLVEANMRYDGSSRFSPENRWGTFPSFSLGWRISEEEFFKGLASTFSELKLRGGWGMLGNQNTTSNYYPAIYTISPGYNYPLGGSLSPGVTVANSANENIKWESTTSWNIGADVSFAKTSLDISFDYFVRNTSDILLQLPVPITFGLPAPFQNAGNVKNNGIELQVHKRGIVNKFKYSASLVGSYIVNKITNWKELDPQPYSSYYFYNTGYPVRAFYGLEATGIYRSEADLAANPAKVNGNVGVGDLIYKDQNNDGKIDGKDRVYLGSPDPKYTFGVNLGGEYKGFDIQIFLQSAAGVKGYLWGEAVGGISGSEKPTEAFLDRFHPTLNPGGNMPRALTTWTQNSPSTNPSSFWTIDGSYLRMKNLTVGYNLPSGVVNRLKIKGAKVYYSGQNLLTFSKFWDGFDPEAPAASRGNFYPQVKTNTIGLNVNF